MEFKKVTRGLSGVRIAHLDLTDHELLYNYMITTIALSLDQTDFYQKQVSMIRKYHNHTLQTNPPLPEEEPQNIYNNKTSLRQKRRAASFSSFSRWLQN